MKTCWFCFTFFKKLVLLYFFSSVLHSILIETSQSKNLEILNHLTAAYQLGLSSSDPTICNHSTFPCQESNLQSRTQCGLIKPLCPVLKFACSLCRFYLSTKTCRKTCQISGKYCGSSGCGSSSTEISPPSEINDVQCDVPGFCFVSNWFMYIQIWFSLQIIDIIHLSFRLHCIWLTKLKTRYPVGYDVNPMKNVPGFHLSMM